MHSVGWTAAGHPKGPERSEGAAQRLDASTAVRHPDSVPQNLTRQPSNNPITTASDTGSALNAVFPLGWTATATAQTALHRGSNVGRPAAGDWIPPADNAAIPAGEAGASARETTPIAWLRWQAGAGGRLRVGVVTAGRALVHRSGDALAAVATIADLAGLEAGDSVLRALDRLFSYDGPAGAETLSYGAVSSDTGKVAAAIESGGYVRLTAVAAGTANIAIVATAPAGQTAALATFAVTKVCRTNSS